MAKEESLEEKSSSKKKAKEVSGKSKKSASVKKASAKDAAKVQSSKKAKEELTGRTVVASRGEEKEEKLTLDITWVAILVFAFFFVGFWVRGVMTPSSAPTTPPVSTPLPGSSQGQSSSGVCPVTGKSGQAGPIDSPTMPTAPEGMGTTPTKSAP